MYYEGIKLNNYHRDSEL